jgi:hypothetical protein
MNIRVTITVLGLFAFHLPTPAAEPPALTFNKDVLPILQKNC